MAIGHQAQTTPSTTGGTVDPIAAIAMPIGTQVGSLVGLFALVRPSTPAFNAPANWLVPSNNIATGGAGAEGADAGTTRMAVYYREWDGVWTMPAVDLGGAPGMSMMGAIAYSKAANEEWVFPLCATGSDTTGSTTSYDPAAAATNLLPGAGDWITAFTCINGDLGTPTVPGTLTEAGVTFGTINSRWNVASTTGNDARTLFHDAPYVSGTSTAGPDTSVAFSGAGANMAGATIFTRLRVQLAPVSRRAKRQYPHYRMHHQPIPREDPYERDRSGIWRPRVFRGWGSPSLSSAA